MEWHQSQFYQYHCATRHSYESVSEGNFDLDWANQADPFRCYEGCPVIKLPPPRSPEAFGYFAARETDAANSREWSLQELSQLLYYSMALSAWKRHRESGVRWSLRVNPSSGNLHPTETHLVVEGVKDLPDGVYHFRVDRFVLEARYQGPILALRRRLGELAGFTLGPVTIVLGSIVWREAWKYRARAWRYCNHDLGHALRSVERAWSGLGHAMQFSHRFDIGKVAKLLGLDFDEEHPGLIISEAWTESVKVADDDPGEPKIEWQGVANVLSPEVTRYEAIDATRQSLLAAARGEGLMRAATLGESPSAIALPAPELSGEDLWRVVRRRRSAVAMDGETTLSLASLSAILAHATAGKQGDLFSIRPAEDGCHLIHLFLYIHRVEGIESGLYYYHRGSHALDPLMTGDQQKAARILSLDQAIASDGAVAFSMLADLYHGWEAMGERGYTAALIEAGWIGQGLYLGAEACGMQATGIGAFFDEDVSRYLDAPEGWKPVYHFTIGHALEDPRLDANDGYAWEWMLR